MIIDKVGQEIKPGRAIAYGHSVRSPARLRVGRVFKVVEKPMVVLDERGNLPDRLDEVELELF